MASCTETQDAVLDSCCAVYFSRIDSAIDTQQYLWHAVLTLWHEKVYNIVLKCSNLVPISTRLEHFKTFEPNLAPIGTRLGSKKT